ncbi:hypothetical protein KZ483_09715 [Paenibacillus sp. sptzw28]|uniref:hypothetical protein n=1 Tax=Paenibacillus sp. sptzw28 TaxID=715179 RepID=UPI001C6EE41B|nr:hypothetical protein [Paenibacillus sp. sptzw28]QYR23166.1 hypothetical protein KZ483_09715 [Paenibacillus sp. sptzw28]
MNELKKKGWLFKGILILAAVVVLALVVKWIGMLLPGQHGYGFDRSPRMSPGIAGPFGNGMRHGAPGAGGMFERGMFKGHGGWFHGFGIWLLLVKIGVIMAGLLLWRKARDGGFGKWAGAALVLGGIWSLLPALLALPIIVLIAYLAYKTRKKEERRYSDIPIQQPTVISNSDVLDQWERDTLKEEK